MMSEVPFVVGDADPSLAIAVRCLADAALGGAVPR